MKKNLLAALAVLAGLGISLACTNPPVIEEVLKIGDKAPDFTLVNAVDGKPYQLSKDFPEATRGYIVTFTCNTCPFAIKYEDRIIALHEKMAPKGYPVVAIQPNDPAIKPGDDMEAMKAQAEKKDYPFVYLFDEGQKVYPQYGASRTPEIFLLDKDLVLRYHGTIDDSATDPAAVTVNYVEQAVEALESGRKPDPATTKAIGCTIKTNK
jgi:peroxiredoxin